jgi:hypothetical protein
MLFQVGWGATVNEPVSALVDRVRRLIIRDQSSWAWGRGWTDRRAG